MQMAIGLCRSHIRTRPFPKLQHFECTQLQWHLSHTRNQPLPACCSNGITCQYASSPLFILSSDGVDQWGDVLRPSELQQLWTSLLLRSERPFSFDQLFLLSEHTDECIGSGCPTGSLSSSLSKIVTISTPVLLWLLLTLSVTLDARELASFICTSGGGLPPTSIRGPFAMEVPGLEPVQVTHTTHLE